MKRLKSLLSLKMFRSNSAIDMKDIEWVKFPKNSASSFITDKSELEEVITLIDLKEGDLLTKNLVRKKLDIPANERVVWLNATDIVLEDQQVKVGDLVDIIVSRELERKVETKRLLSNIKVVERDKEGGIKISLPLEQAEKLIHYQNFAKQIRVLVVNQVNDNKEAVGEKPAKPIVEEKPEVKEEKKKVEPVTDVKVEDK